MSHYSDVLDDIHANKTTRQYAGFNPMSAKVIATANYNLIYSLIGFVAISCLLLTLYFLNQTQIYPAIETHSTLIENTEKNPQIIVNSKTQSGVSSVALDDVDIMITENMLVELTASEPIDSKRGILTAPLSVNATQMEVDNSIDASIQDAKIYDIVISEDKLFDMPASISEQFESENVLKDATDFVPVVTQRTEVLHGDGYPKVSELKINAQGEVEALVGLVHVNPVVLNKTEAINKKENDATYEISSGVVAQADDALSIDGDPIGDDHQINERSEFDDSNSKRDIDSIISIEPKIENHKENKIEIENSSNVVTSKIISDQSDPQSYVNSISQKKSKFNMKQLLEMVANSEFEKALVESTQLPKNQMMVVQAKVYEQIEPSKAIDLYKALILEENSPIEYVLKLAILNEKINELNQALYFYEMFQKHNTDSNQNVSKFVQNKIKKIRSL